MTELIKRVENGQETFDERVDIARRVHFGKAGPIHALFENVQTVIDAVEEVFPGLDIIVQNTGHHIPMWHGVLSEQAPEQGDKWTTVGMAETPAPALLAALLRAMDRPND